MPHPRQLQFLKDRRRERWLYAANRAGKTRVGAVEALYHATGSHPHRNVPESSVGWIISLSYEMQFNNIQPTLEQYLQESKVYDILKLSNDVWQHLIFRCARCGGGPKEKRSDGIVTGVFRCGKCMRPISHIGFKSCDQGRAKFQGASLGWAWIDEEPPEDIRAEVKVRLWDKQGDLWVTMTPVEGTTWSYDAIYLKGESDPNGPIAVVKASVYDNPYLDHDALRIEEAQIADEAEREIRFYGTPRARSGVIYPEWDAAIHEVAELPRELLGEDLTPLKSLNAYMGIDTGSCFAAVLVIVDYLGNFWCVDEYYAVSRPIPEHARALHAMCQHWDVWPEFVVDPRTQHDVDLADLGISCTKPPAMEVREGIALVRNLVFIDRTRPIGYAAAGGNPSLYVLAARMPRFLFEIRHYVWKPSPRSRMAKDTATSEPLKRDDHVMDALRMVAQLRPPPSVPDEVAREKSTHETCVDQAMKRAEERDRARDGGDLGDGLEDS